MHGQPRKPLRQEDSASKASSLRDLQSQLLHNHRHRLYTKEAISTSSKLLEINPEILTAWNYRKLVFQKNLQEATYPELIKSLVEDELRVVEMALRRNPKSYGAWYHRKWVLRQGLVEVDFDREYRLLDQLLKADARNFHGWNYRRFVTKLDNVPDIKELKFTMDMIDTNFSNYSAWHNRSALLSRLLIKKAQGFAERENILTEEYELVRQALFTDPSDQSGWFYHLWLLDQTVTPEEVLLISSWPPHESDWVLSINENTAYCKLFQPMCSSYYFFKTRKLPIILYFNQTVKGVNTSSIIVNSMFVKNEDLVWSPLPPTRSQEAACWVSFLQIPLVQYSDTKSFLVEVNLGHSECILSSSGSQYNHPLQLRFNMSINSESLQDAGEELIDELLVWNYVGSHAAETSALVSFDQLYFSEDSAPDFSKWQWETISNEINLFKELSEENCTFVKITLARLLVAQDAMISHRSPTRETLMHSREVLELFDDLIKLDPGHAGYYEDERSLALMNQVTSDYNSFWSHYSHSSHYASSKLRLYRCIQLKNLSLTRIGFVERLLWVQMLDLSRNNLRSIVGIETLQLLNCLNLSRNQISSFSALEPLKHLSYLRVLDISFNKIGTHSVDTTRYLFSSPYHSMQMDEKCIEEYRLAGINVADHWEAVLLFRDLPLKQLDAKGNAIADEKFRDLVKKVLPNLTWFDGERL